MSLKKLKARKTNELYLREEYIYTVEEKIAEIKIENKTSEESMAS